MKSGLRCSWRRCGSAASLRKSPSVLVRSYRSSGRARAGPGAVFLSGTRREYIPVGSTAASMPQRVPERNTAPGLSAMGQLRGGDSRSEAALVLRRQNGACIGTPLWQLALLGSRARLQAYTDSVSGLSNSATTADAVARLRRANPTPESSPALAGREWDVSPGPSAAGMPQWSLHGRIHGVSRRYVPLPARPRRVREPQSPGTFGIRPAQPGYRNRSGEPSRRPRREALTQEGDH